MIADVRSRVAAALLLLSAGACSGGDGPQRSAPQESAPPATLPTTLPADSAPEAGGADGVRPLTGMMTYLADAPRFTECGSGTSFVMAADGDYLAAERAYLDAGAQGEPLRVTFDGRVARRPGMEGGDVDAVVVTRFGGAEPGRGCGDEPVTAPLEGTLWSLVALPGARAVPAGARATLVLDPEARTASGSTGCNRFTGRYDLQGGRLTVGITATTRMACPEALVALDADFLEALRVAGSYRFVGAFLELLGETGPVARFAPPEG